MFCLIFLPFVTIYGCNHVKIQTPLIKKTIEFSKSLLVEEKLNYVQNSEQIQQ